MKNHNKRLVLSKTLLDSINKLNPSIQSQVNQQLSKLMINPDLRGFNLEKLQVKDNSFHSIRVDDNYRIILSLQGSIMLLLWVDKHDDAYHWARSHQCTINAETGGVQLYTTEMTPSIQEKIEADQQKKEPGLFDELRDRQLMKLGVPQEQLETVRAIRSEEALDALENYLPSEAYEGLFFYLAGDRYEDILREREIQADSQFNIADFSAALERAQTQAEFSVVSGEKELEEVLSASLEKWRIYLHTSQRKIAYGDKNGAVRVLGGAGTGKTVVAMHRAKWLAENRLQQDEKILFTTYTKNLAQDIHDNLKALCGEKLLQHIEVTNLDAWVNLFLRQQGYGFEIVYDEKKLDELWERANADINLSFIEEPEKQMAFFKEEWQQVIQPQSIFTLEEYKRAKRTGRGTRLSRQERIQIWPIFERYRSLLTEHQYKEIADAYRDTADFLIKNPNLAPQYAHIIVDEAQDMDSHAFRVLRALVPEGPNDLFIVGDAHQRIYNKHKVVLGQLGIHIVGRSYKLRINYRTTEEIRAAAVSLLNNQPVDDFDGGNDDNQYYRSLIKGKQPQIEHFNTEQAQNDFISQYVQMRRDNDPHLSLNEICIIARTNNEIEKIKKYLDHQNIPCYQIQTSEANIDKNAIRLATIHRVKGLEFDTIILASCNEGLIPFDLAIKNRADDISKEEAIFQERALLYVALTRAKREVIICSYGKESPFLINLETKVLSS